MSTLRDRPAALLGLLVILNALSIADMLFTWRELGYGAVEGNILIASIIGASPVAAVVFKIGATLAVSVLIWSARRYRLVLATAIGATAMYAVLIAYHVGGLASIGAL